MGVQFGEWRLMMMSVVFLGDIDMDTWRLLLVRQYDRDVSMKRSAMAVRGGYSHDGKRRRHAKMWLGCNTAFISAWVQGR